MKKCMIMIMLAVVTTATYAKDECSSVANYAFSTENNANAIEEMKPNYHFNIHANSIANYLYLAEDQKYEVEEIHNGFMADMRKAARTEDVKKARKIARRAVISDMYQMRNVLSEWQFDRYKAVLNATMKNRGIKY